jgi:DNA-binding LytR/AlgR family response regulator
MPGMSGLTVAQLLGKKPIIFVTGSDDKFRAALDLGPVDIVTKPFTQERVNRALSKFGAKSVEYGVFNVAESKRKVNIHLPDILYVCSDNIDPRNKMAVIKGGESYTLMNNSFTELKALAPQLVQINRQELVSIDLVKEMGHDCVSLNDAGIKTIPLESTLTATCKDELAKRMFYR